MIISLVAAMSHHRVIGLNNRMPWHCPADLKHFKAVTMGKPIVMGRKTFDSIGKALPGRRNIVITRQTDWQAPGVEVAHSLEAVFGLCREEAEVMIIGGANIYEQCLKRAHQLYLTFIDADYEGDTFFPEWSEVDWRETNRVHHQHDNKNPHDYSFVRYQRQP